MSKLSTKRTIAAAVLAVSGALASTAAKADEIVFTPENWKQYKNTASTWQGIIKKLDNTQRPLAVSRFLDDIQTISNQANNGFVAIVDTDDLSNPKAGYQFERITASTTYNAGAFINVKGDTTAEAEATHLHTLNEYPFISEASLKTNGEVHKLTLSSETPVGLNIHPNFHNPTVNFGVSSDLNETNCAFAGLESGLKGSLADKISDTLKRKTTLTTTFDTEYCNTSEDLDATLGLKAKADIIQPKPESYGIGLQAVFDAACSVADKCKVGLSLKLNFDALRKSFDTSKYFDQFKEQVTSRVQNQLKR